MSDPTRTPYNTSSYDANARMILKIHSFFFALILPRRPFGFSPSHSFHFARYLTYCSHHSSPFLHQPRVGRTTCFLPELFSSSQDFDCLFLIFLAFSFSNFFKNVHISHTQVHNTIKHVNTFSPPYLNMTLSPME